MRIVVVTTWFPDAARPGTAPFVLAHARAIASRHDVEVVHLRLGSAAPVVEEYVGGLRVTRIPVDPRQPHRVVAALVRLRAAVAGADLVHSMAFSSLGVLAPLYPVIASRWVHTERWSGVGFPEQVSTSWRRLAFARHLLRLPLRVSAVSTMFAGTVRGFARDGAVDVVANVVDGSAGIAPMPTTNGRLRLVAVGGLVARKRPLLAVDTVGLLRRDGLDVELEWVGDGPMRAETERRAAELGLSDRVRLAGSVPPQQVAEHLDRAHVFFLPTRFETFFVAGAEALARGRPVVLPAGGPYADYVDETVGVLVTEDTARGYADAIRTASERFGGVAPETFRAAVLPRFGAESVAQSFDDFYARALS